ncbi:hypothetical protein [Nocardiopsis salina]|uniref:hypothetical protein n=1 Tax=Nocardiopsis salina TaxID=245836 RepID=UPI00034BDAD4|nr:hypothetical protein [Nocardiopsis salina]
MPATPDPIHDLDRIGKRINRIEMRMTLDHEVERTSRAVTAGLAAGGAVLFMSLHLVWAGSDDLSGWETLFTDELIGTFPAGLAVLAMCGAAVTALVVQRIWAFRTVLGTAAAFPLLWMLGWALAASDTTGDLEAGPGPWCAMAGTAVVAAAAHRAESLGQKHPSAWD